MDCYMLVACCLRTAAEIAAHIQHSCTDLRRRGIVSCDCRLSKEHRNQMKVFPNTAKSCWDKLGSGTHCSCCSNRLSVFEVMLGKTSYDKQEWLQCRYLNHKNLHYYLCNDVSCSCNFASLWTPRHAHGDQRPHSIQSGSWIRNHLIV